MSGDDGLALSAVEEEHLAVLHSGCMAEGFPFLAYERALRGGATDAEKS